MPITITSRFTPLTYDEISRPLIEQTRAQQELEGAYMDVQDKASELLARANQQTDFIAYTRLKSYSDELQKQAEALMQRGLDRNSRQRLMNMRRRYSQDIVPVQAAIARRDELAEERRKLQLTHPDMMWERDILNLDDILQNPQLDYGKTIMGSELSKRAANITAAIGRGRQQLALGQNLDKYTQQVLNQSGLTPDEIQAALAGDNSPLDKALQGLYESTGVDSWSNRATRDAVRNYINEGALSAAGQLSISTQRDNEYLRRQQLADRDEERRWQLKLHGYKLDDDGNIVEDPGSVVPRTGKGVTTTGDEITIDSVGPNTKKYGTIGKSPDGTFYRRVGSAWQKIDDQDEAARLFTHEDAIGTSTEVPLTPTQLRERESFMERTNGKISVRKDLVGKRNKTPKEIEEEIVVALGQPDTEYKTIKDLSTAQQDQMAELLKGTGHNPEDFYYIKSYGEGISWSHEGADRDHYILILKDVASDEIKAKYSGSTATAPTTTEHSPETNAQPPEAVSDSISRSFLEKE